METVRLEVRNRTVLLDRREFVFVTEDGSEVLRTDTEGVVLRVERFTKRRMRGSARVHGRAQLLQALRQFNSPKEGYTQFIVVETRDGERLSGLSGPERERALDDVVVRAVRARLPIDLGAIERWVRDRGLWIGLSGKNQVLGGKVRLASQGLTSNFEPEKLLARSLLDKPEAFRGGTLRILVVDDPFVDGVCGDGAFLLRESAARECSRVVTQRVRRSLDYQVQDARRGEVYLRLEFEDKVARHDTEILSVREDGDLLWVEKRESARIDTGAKLVHELGWKGTAVVVDSLPGHVERDWPGVDGVCNASCVKSNALLSALSQPALWGEGKPAFVLHLPVRMLFTGGERFSADGNRISLNVLSTLHTVSPDVLDRVVESRVDESPGPVVSALLWWAERLSPGSKEPGGVSKLPTRSKHQLKNEWGEAFERRFAFGDLPDHPVFDPSANPEGFVATGRGGNRVLVPSARVLLATLGRVDVEGEPGFFFPEYANTLLQALRCLDVKPERFAKVLEQLAENVLRAANATIDAHSIRVPGIHGVLVAVRDLGDRVVVPDGVRPFRGTVHGEPTMNRDGIRRAVVEPLSLARERGATSPTAKYLLDHLVGEDFSVVLADFGRLTRMNRDNDGDLIYLSRIRAGEHELADLDARAETAPAFVDVSEREGDASASFSELRADHDPCELSAEAVHKAVLETAGSARDVGSITLWKYVAQEALAQAGARDGDHLVAVVAKIAQAYIDGLKGPHQQSANLFAALMRCWSRMSVPCVAVREDGKKDGVTVAVRLADALRRELLRAGYVEGKDFHGRVDVPHPSLVDEAFRRIKAPLVSILEEILGGIEEQGIATRGDLVRLRAVLETSYGQYPSQEMADRDAVVAERRAAYTAVRRLYGIVPVRSLADVEEVGVRPLWGRLMALSAGGGDGAATLDRMARRALAHGVRPERVTL